MGMTKKGDISVGMVIAVLIVIFLIWWVGSHNWDLAKAFSIEYQSASIIIGKG